MTKGGSKTSPETQHSRKEVKTVKGKGGNTKVLKHKIRPKAFKINNKHKLIKEKSIRASSGSNRSKFLKDKDPLNNTGSKIIKDKEAYKKL